MSNSANWTVCQIVCWALSAIGGIAVLWGTIEPVGFIGALMAGVAVAVFLGLVFSRLVCTGEAPVAGAVAGGAIGKLMGTEPAGATPAAAAASATAEPKVAAAPEAPKPAPAAKPAAPEAPKAKAEDKADAKTTSTASSG